MAGTVHRVIAVVIVLAHAIACGPTAQPPDEVARAAEAARVAAVRAAQAAGEQQARAEASRARERAESDRLQYAAAHPPPTEAPIDPFAADARFGSLAIDPGFRPDPKLIAGETDPVRDASELGAGCLGAIAAQPDVILVAKRPFVRLRLIARGQVGTTLVVQRPDGTFACAGEAIGDRAIVEGPVEIGVLRVWIGSPAIDAKAAFGFAVTELGSIGPDRVPIR